MQRAMSLVLLLVLAVSTLSVAVFADEDGWTLSREEMMDKDKVILYLSEHPRKTDYLPEEIVAGLIYYIESQEATTFGARLRMLRRVKFNLDMRMLDIQLDRLLRVGTFKPEGFMAEKQDHFNKGYGEPDKDGAIVNKVEVTAKGPIGTVVYDDDEAKVMAMHPSIDVVKSPNEQMVVAGKAVRFNVHADAIGIPGQLQRH